MKFTDPRPIMTPEIAKIAKREIRKQRIEVIRATRKELKALFLICKAVESSGLPENLVLKKLPDNLGHGIFLDPKAKPIPKGTLIGFYAGKVSIGAQNAPGDSAYAFAPICDMHLSKKEQAYFDPKRAFHPRRLYALDIDAKDEGNFIRFINHSSKPNIVAHLYQIPKNSLNLSPSPVEVIYAAKKTIRPGEQLLINYEGDDQSYWNHLNIKPVPMDPRTYLQK